MNVDTVALFTKQIDFPAVKYDYFLTQTEENIITILENTPAPTVPSIEDGDETKNALLKLALIFDQKDGIKKKLSIHHKKNNQHSTTKIGSTTNRTSASDITIDNSYSIENKKVKCSSYSNQSDNFKTLIISARNFCTNFKGVETVLSAQTSQAPSYNKN